MAQQGAVVIDVIADIEQAQANLENLKLQLEDVDTQELDVNLDTTQAEQSIQKLKSDIENLNVEASSSASGLGGVFEGIISRVGSKVTGLGSSFSSIFTFAKQGLTEIGMKMSAILGIVGIIIVVSSMLIDIVKQVVGENAELNQELQQVAEMLNAVIKPIVETLKNIVLVFLKGVIKVLKAILGWVRDIIKAVSGDDIFAGLGEIKIEDEVSGLGGAVEGIGTNAKKFTNETAKADKNTKSINKNTGGISKNLKEARKQLAGFDEMNVLNDNKTAGAGGGGSTNLGGLGGLGGGLSDTTKDLTTNIDKVNSKVDETRECIADLSKISLDTFEDMRIDVLKTVTSGGKLTKVQKTHISYFDAEIKRLITKDKLTGQEQIRLATLTKMYGDLHREGALNNEQEKLYKILMDKSTPTVKSKRKAVKELMESQNKNNETTKKTREYINDEGISLEDIAKKYGLSKEQVDKLKESIDKYNTSTDPNKSKIFADEVKRIGNEAELTLPDIVGLKSEIKTMKGKDIDINVNQPKKDALSKISSFITKWTDPKAIELEINKPKETVLKKITDSITNFFNKYKPSVVVETVTKTTTKTKGNKKGAIIKYASGGIINQPGRGVPLAVGGEAGREGVIPLTDSQQMALLGEAIGKYITINANITNSMNGRVLSRELQKIQNEEAFGSNRW